jgi:hypothetical protein
MGGNNKIAPPNRFARVKTFLVIAVEKPQTLFSRNLLSKKKWILGERMRAHKKGFCTIPFLCNTRNKK